jgi:hypothetical protein
MSIILLGISRRGDSNVYDLNFDDEGKPVSFVFEFHPERSGFSGAGPFLTYFSGRTGGREAMDALMKVHRGEHVAFPVEINITGQSNKWA